MTSKSRLRERLNPPPPLETDEGFRALLERRFREQQRSARQHRFVAGLALAACAALALLLVSHPVDIAPTTRRAQTSAPTVARAPAPPVNRLRPVQPTPQTHDISGRVDRAFDTLRAGDTPVTKAFDDGTVLTLEAHAQLTTTGVSERRVSARIDTGEIVFDLEPMVGRRWDLDAHAVQLQAVDARFAVRRTDRAVRVQVIRGAVLVYAAHLPQGQVRMTDGQTLHFEAASEARREPAPRDLRRQSVAMKATQTQVSSASRQPTVQQTVPSVDDEKSADELLANADWARQSHDVDGAIAILARFMERYPADRRVGVAAFTLGKLTLRSDPAGAARWFQLALDRGVPRMMAEGVAARLVEALAKVGDVEAAKVARKHYDATYPHGVHRDEVAQWAP